MEKTAVCHSALLEILGKLLYGYFLQHVLHHSLWFHACHSIDLLVMLQMFSHSQQLTVS